MPLQTEVCALNSTRGIARNGMLCKSHGSASNPHCHMSSTTAFATTPEPPYYAVIFTSQRSETERGYDPMAQRMAELASKQPGFLGIESVRGADGFGITVSYWANEAAIVAWRSEVQHRAAQEAGKNIWYSD